MLTSAVEGLNPGGRLAVITFHSLEDRIVKQTLRDLSRGCTCPPEFPVCVCGNKPKVRLVTRKPIVADQAELADNPAPAAPNCGWRKNATHLISDQGTGPLLCVKNWERRSCRGICGP